MNSPKELILYVAADTATNRFAVADQKGRDVWFGEFSASDQAFDSTQVLCELQAAKKVVWLATKIAEEAQAPIFLTLKTSCRRLLFANDVQEGELGKGIRRLANKRGLGLRVEMVDVTANLAANYLAAPGPRRFVMQECLELLKEASSLQLSRRGSQLVMSPASPLST